MNWIKKSYSCTPYFSVSLKSSNATTLVFYEQRNLGIRDSHVINLIADDWKEWISLLSCEPSTLRVVGFSYACSQGTSLLHSLQFLFCLCFVSFIFRADTSLFLFNLIFENLNLHIFRIIIIIIRCSGMFRNVPCSCFYRRPSAHLFFWEELNLIHVGHLYFNHSIFQAIY